MPGSNSLSGGEQNRLQFIHLPQYHIERLTQDHHVSVDTKSPQLAIQIILELEPIHKFDDFQAIITSLIRYPDDPLRMV